MLTTTVILAQDPPYGWCTEVEGIDLQRYFECELRDDQTWAVAESFCETNPELNLTEDRFTCGGSAIADPPHWACAEGDDYCCLPCIPNETPEGSLLRGESCSLSGENECDKSQQLMCSYGRCIYSRAVVSRGGECFDTSECIQEPYYGSFAPNTVHVPVECKKEPGELAGVCEVQDSYCYEDEDCEGERAVCDLGRCVVENVEPAKPAEDTETPGVPYDYCAQVPGKIEIKKEEGKETEIKAEKGSQYEACQKCMGRFNPETGEYPNEGQKIYTAVGCISVDGKGFATDLIKLLLGVGGMATLLSILAASFIYTTSRGDSGKIKEAKDLITSAVSGLLFIIFSVIMLEYIGVQVLHIPGLGGGGESGAIVPTSPPLATLAYSVEEGGACRRDIDCKRMSSLTCEDGVCTDTMDRLAMGSVPLGGECYFNEHCISSTPVNDPDNPEIEYPGSVQCENNQCKLKFVGVTPCAEKADKDGYCQELLDNSRAHCIENTDWNSLCSIPWADPEIIQCNVTNSPSKAYTTEPNYCNEAMNSSSDKYECFTPPGGTAGYCRDAKLSKSK